MAKRRTKSSATDEVIGILQESVGRYAKLWSGTATQISQGDLSIGKWMHQYADAWKGLADDMQRIADVMLKTVSKQQTTK